jgi:putative tryptophan/tyrosine transport system substrate-binding protein
MAIHIRRRELIFTLGGAAAAWPLTAPAQQPDRVRRIGVLMSLAESDPEAQLRIAAIRKGLQERGWVDGRNVWIDFRWGAGDAGHLRANAAELAGSNPDVILAVGGSAAVAARRETKSVPIVFTQVPDPVSVGLVESLARPGGNTTGFAQYEAVVAAKWLELLKQLAPNVVRAAIVFDPVAPAVAGYLRDRGGVADARRPGVARRRARSRRDRACGRSVGTRA